jgi:2-oxoglutarate/2-oxoacid ferredoxin oxidoreductase subunit alpha
LREEKVKRVENFIPEQEIIGEQSGKLLVVSWGGTYGVMLTAVNEMLKEGEKISLAHFSYINPLPKNTEDIFSRFDKIIVCENNNGQFISWLKMNFPHFNYLKYTKVQGLPFMVSELKRRFNEILSK